MTEFLLNVLLPVAVFVVMLISGTGVQASDIRSAKVFGRSLSICLGTQMVVGPAAVFLLIGGSESVTFIALGLLVLSICPSGTLSTGYTYIAGGNVALSAVMSTSGTLLSLGAGRAAASFVAPRDRSALTIECAVRNIPVAMVIARDVHAQGTLTGFFVGFPSRMR